MVGHIKFCTGIPGLIETFDKQNLVTFEDNLKYKGDLLFVSYCDFETTAPTDYYLDSKNKVIFAI